MAYHDARNDYDWLVGFKSELGTKYKGRMSLEGDMLRFLEVDKNKLSLNASYYYKPDIGQKDVWKYANLEIVNHGFIVPTDKFGESLLKDGELSMGETTKTVRDPNTGFTSEQTTEDIVYFQGVFEYQSDNKLHLVELGRNPKKEQPNKYFPFEYFNIGLTYLIGNDRNKAIEWFKKGASNGHPACKDKLKELGA